MSLPCFRSLFLCRFFLILLAFFPFSKYRVRFYLASSRFVVRLSLSCSAFKHRSAAVFGCHCYLVSLLPGFWSNFFKAFIFMYDSSTRGFLFTLTIIRVSHSLILYLGFCLWLMFLFSNWFPWYPCSDWFYFPVSCSATDV